MNTGNETMNPASRVVPLVAPQREARSCHELGVCLHPARACGLRCEQVALQQLHRVVLAQPPRTDTPAAPTQPFGVEGPYRRERMTRGDRWRLGAALAAGAVISLALVYVLGAFVLKPLVQGAVVLLAKVGG